METLSFKILDKPNDEQLAGVRALRIKVFVEEQGFALGNEACKNDYTCWHIEVKLAGQVIGTSRMVFHDGYYFMGRVAIAKEHRGKGYGRRMLEEVLAECKRRGYQRIKVEAQMHVVELYEKFGFVKEGAVEVIAGADHQRLYKDL